MNSRRFLLYALLALIGSLIPTTNTQASASCAETDEDCLERFMHPRMPVTETRKHDYEARSEYWLENGRQFVEQKRATADSKQKGVAKNVVFVIGDGMSLTTLAATRVYLGGEEQQLSFEHFPDTGLAKTYAIDRLVADSASTATAYLSGSKANFGTIGVNGHVKRGDCNAAKATQNYVDSIAKWALDKGKAVGLVTTSRVTHASPAALYAHTSERHWENDRQVESDCGANSGVKDIAQQLISGEVGKQLKVVFGGGKTNFVHARNDGRNLIDEFLHEHRDNVFVENKSQLNGINVGSAKRVLGLFNDDDLEFHLHAGANQPTVEEMTAKAIELLEQSPNGYILFVNGGLINEAHHQTKAKLAIDEAAELNKAVQLARLWTNQDDTLVIFSADHSNTMSLAGYAPRSNDIFGTGPTLAEDDTPYMTLNYANGPSFAQFFNLKTNHRNDPRAVLHQVSDDVFPATAPMDRETNGGEDVPVYASGPWSLLFSGVYEQSTIPHLIAFAACLRDGKTACNH